MKAQRTVDHIQEPLCGSLTELAGILKFGCVLCERGAESRADVNDGGGGFHPR
jgi:hypothetical protein